VYCWREIRHLSIFQKSVEKIQFSSQYDDDDDNNNNNNNGYFKWGPKYTFDHISLNSSHNEKFLEKSCRKNQNIFYVQFFLILPFMRYSINPLTPNDHYRGCTAPLTSKLCIWYIYSTNKGTEYFKHGIYSPFFSLETAVCFIILAYFVPVLFTFIYRMS